MTNLALLIQQLAKQPTETPWLEFKHNNAAPQMIGADISALANSATLHDRDCAYMIWGINDQTHEIVGTDIRLKQLKKGNQEIENWLRFLLSKNADFEFDNTDIDGNHVEVIIIRKAFNEPVAFEKTDYVRIGSYTKKLNEFSTVRASLWDKLRQSQYETTVALSDLNLQEALNLLHWNAYFDLLNITPPADAEALVHYLLQDEILVKQDNGLYGISNLGALLFAKDLNRFSRLGRKALRVVQYNGINRLNIAKEDTANEGYAISIERMVRFIAAIIPSNENINAVQLQVRYKFPLPVIREAIANALIHQDLHLTGVGPVVEIFDNRIEVTNPGTPLVDINRIIDNPPKSRNEKLASLMRRLRMCEELGRGWDRMVITCEQQFLTAPRIVLFDESTKVIIYSHIDFSKMSVEDKLWSCYMHACVQYLQDDFMNNSSLRQRYNAPDTMTGSISRLIKQAVEKGLIKPFDSSTAPRYMRYIPFWA